MRKRTILLVLIAVLAVPMLYAADAGTMKTKSHTEVTGTIDQVDLKTMTLTLKVEAAGSDQPEMKIYTFDTKTAFRKKDASNKDESFKAEELKVGDKVKVKSDASNLAVEISLESAAARATQDQSEQKQE